MDIFESVVPENIFWLQTINGLIQFAVVVVTYLLSSLGMYAIAKKRNVANAWLVWIPVVGVWLEGRVADAYCKRFENRTTHYAPWMLGLAVGFALLVAIMYAQLFSIMFLAVMQYTHAEIVSVIWNAVGWGIAAAAVEVALIALQMLARYRIYYWCSKKAVCMIVLSVLIPVTSAFFLFFIRKNVNPELQDAKLSG